MQRLHALVYVSSAVAMLDQATIDVLLEKARARNRQYAITGLLLYCEGNFMQYIEGPQNNLAYIYDIILADPLHKSIVELVNGEIPEREMTEWSMAYRNVGKEQFSKLRDADWLNSINPRDLGLGSQEGKILLREFWRHNR